MHKRRRPQEYQCVLHLPPTDESTGIIKQKLADAYTHEIERRLKNCELTNEQKSEVLEELLKVYHEKLE